MEREEYRRMAEAEDTMWWYRALHDRLVERTAQLRLPPGARVLDAGCGTGGLLHRLEDALPALSYTGIDLDGPCLEVAGKRTAASLHHRNVNPFRSRRVISTPSSVPMFSARHGWTRRLQYASSCGRSDRGRAYC